MSTITINGKSYTGNNIKVTNNRVFIDSKDVTSDDGKAIYINVVGDIEELKVDACNHVSVTGAVGILSTVSGDVEVGGNVIRNVQTVSGDVKCGDVMGSVSTVSGDVIKS